ncbi:hypothetical protein [Beggiatoa alba]|nr:hypothetical protein [Beggiatoa alba]
MNMITSLFCSIDDFYKWFIPLWEQNLLAEGNTNKSRVLRI